MPINPENRALYPPDWAAISRAVREDQGNKCARCLKPHLATVSVAGGGWWFDAEADLWRGPDHQCTQEDPEPDGKRGAYRVIKVVLTCAHVHDPNPANVSRENLQSLCQFCHNVLDMPMRQRNAALTRRAKIARIQPALEI